MFFAGGVDGPVDCFISPRMEAELAFILAWPLRGPNVMQFDVLSATAFVSPAIEIVDARIEQFDRDTLSDFAANGVAGLGWAGQHQLPLRLNQQFTHRPTQAHTP